MQINPAASHSMLAALRATGLDAPRSRAVPPRRTSERRSPWIQLLGALLDLGEGHAELVRHAERGWASATFSGARHTVVLVFNGEPAIAAAERLIEALPAHEFTIPRSLVADANVISIDHRTLPGPTLELEVELLLLDDA